MNEMNYFFYEVALVEKLTCLLNSEMKQYAKPFKVRMCGLRVNAFE